MQQKMPVVAESGGDAGHLCTHGNVLRGLKHQDFRNSKIKLLKSQILKGNTNVGQNVNSVALFEEMGHLPSLAPSDHLPFRAPWNFKSQTSRKRGHCDKHTDSMSILENPHLQAEPDPQILTQNTASRKIKQSHTKDVGETLQGIRKHCAQHVLRTCALGIRSLVPAATLSRQQSSGADKIVSWQGPKLNLVCPISHSHSFLVHYFSIRPNITEPD